MKRLRTFYELGDRNRERLAEPQRLAVGRGRGTRFGPHSKKARSVSKEAQAAANTKHGNIVNCWAAATQQPVSVYVGVDHVYLSIYGRGNHVCVFMKHLLLLSRTAVHTDTQTQKV